MSNIFVWGYYIAAPDKVAFCRWCRHRAADRTMAQPGHTIGCPKCGHTEPKVSKPNIVKVE